MSGAKRSTWIGGTVVVAVLMLVASWFLLVSPAMADASATHDEAEQVRSQNDMLTQRVAQLEADFQSFPEYKAELVALQLKVPATAQLSEIVRQLDAVAVSHAVVVDGLNPTAPISAEAPASAAPAPDPNATAPTDGSSPAPSESPSADAGAAGATESAAPVAPVPNAAPAGLVALPVQIKVSGSYDNVMAFLSDVQNTLPRVYLVTVLAGAGLGEGGATAGRPATHEGDLELTVDGYFYVLPSADAAPAPDPAAMPIPLPAPVPGKNPLVPVQGH